MPCISKLLFLELFTLLYIYGTVAAALRYTDQNETVAAYRSLGLRKGSAINKRRLAESDDKLVMLAAIQAFREALAEAATDPASLMSTQTLKRHSRGIVISGGGELQFVNAYATMRVIREVHGSMIPIVLAYYGQDEYVPWIANEMKVMSHIHFKDVSQQQLPPHLLRNDANLEELAKNGFFKKILALYQTPFHEVMYLDSDSMPTNYPEEIFETPGYLSAGSMFSTDLWAEGVFETPKAECYELLGLTPPWLKGPWGSVDSGQLLLNLKQHRDVLDWIVFLNSHHDILYRYAYGDKDFFEMAFMLAGKHEAHFYRNPLLPRLAMEIATSRGDYRMVGEAHVTEAGMPIFLHRVAKNKLDLGIPVFRTPRPTKLTSTISHNLTHKFVQWKGESIGHILPAEILNTELNCPMLDIWILKAWYKDPSWIPREYTDTINNCLALHVFEHTDSIQDLEKLRVALIPVESFGTDFYMALNLQMAALSHLKLLHQEAQLKFILE